MSLSQFIKRPDYCQSCSGNKGEKILIARAETNAPLADFQCKSQSSSGYKKRKFLIARAEIE